MKPSPEHLTFSFLSAIPNEEISKKKRNKKSVWKWTKNEKFKIFLKNCTNPQTSSYITTQFLYRVLHRAKFKSFTLYAIQFAT